MKKLESVLSKKIKDIYEARLKHQVTDISYKLFDKTLIILIEGTVTPVEQLLNQSDRRELAKQVRNVIDNIVHTEIKILIEEVINVKIVDFLSDTTINSNRTGAIAIFEFKPESFDNSD
jgi:uncharacterized protein YbcI